MHWSLSILILSAFVLLSSEAQSDCSEVPTRNYYVDVDEEVDEGTLVFDGRTYFDSLEVTYTHIRTDISDFSIVFEDNFEENPDGVFRTKGDFDREVMANLLHNTFAPVVFNFTIFSFDAFYNLLGCQYVGIHVVDEDDNVPRFEVEEFNVLFNDDDTTVDQLVPLHPPAVDDDEGLNGIRYYNLTDDLGVFYLDVRMDEETLEIATVSLRNSVPLDREQQECYNLTLVASEGLPDPDVATITVNACVEDRCDESPYFVMSHYQPSLPEDSPINTTIANVTAYDDDLGTYGQVQYYIDRVCSTSSPQATCQTVSKPYPFHLDMESGELVLDGELDRESDTEFMVTVRAEDGCERTATATVVITLEDVNDNPPEVTYSAHGYNEGTHSVSEFLSVPSDLGHISVSDPDLGANGSVSVQMFEVDVSTEELFESEKFSITSEGYTLKLIGELDHEDVSLHTLMIIACDMGQPPLMSNFTLNIEVVDFNDNPPIFEPISPMIELSEDATVNELVVKLKAEDADSDSNGRVTYELPPSNSVFRHQELFKVDNAGMLKVNGTLDREEQEVIQVLVVARDNPTSGDSFSASIVVNITLLDVNDNAPEIISLVKTVNISEAQEPDHVVATVVVQDNDTELHSTLTYSLVPSSGPFEIDSQGVIRLVSALDFEVSPSYSLSIHVSDVVHDTSQILTVYVEDVNDEPPKFNLAGPIAKTVPENQDPGWLVAQIYATDPDTPLEQLSYTIAHGNLEHFRIESDGSGNIYTKVRLDREDVSQYTLFVRVSDGLHYSPNDAQVDVTVADENDNPPEFVGLPFEFTVPENAVAGMHVGTVQAQDADEELNGMIRYEFTGGHEDGLFDIDRVSGIVNTTQVLDRELLPSVYQLNVRIYDQGDPPRFSNSETVTVTILDENDNGPDFAEDIAEFNLPENLGTGHVFGNVKAHDPDISPNNLTKYSISQASPADALTLFHIDPDSGDLSLAETLDFEMETSHEFVVLALDETTTDPQREDSITVRITVLNTMDPILAFEESFPLSFHIGEDASPGEPLYEFRVIDRNTESPVLSDLEYTLTNLDGSTSQQFDVTVITFESHARIYTIASDLDRENPSIPDEYYLNLTVRDIRPPDIPDSYGSLSHGFTVTITDINDNHPNFTEESYFFDIDENEGADRFVGTVHAVDPDNGENSTVLYRIQGSVPFDIDANNGHITARESLDYEEKHDYIFYVVAEDQGVISLSSEVSVTVNVNDLNDNRPEFDPDQNHVVPEDSEVGTKVATIGVSDPDSGIYGQVEVTVAPGSRLDPHFDLRTNGDIYLISPLDYDEGEIFYSFEARARDGAIPWKERRAVINITVADVNDNAPEFLNTTFFVSIPEDIHNGIYFTSLAVDDKDSGTNGEVQFTLADTSLSHIFSVERSTGKISLRPPSPDDYPGPLPDVVDYERTQSYDVEIVAYDKGIPRNIARKTLRVTIENVNEFHPVFDAGSVTAFVDEGLPPGTKVITLEAYDWDFDLLEYSITDQGPYEHFRWDSASKSIVTIQELDYILSHNYYLTLHATESGTQHNSSVLVHVVVVNVNDHNPEFTEQSISHTISEETAPGTVVLTVSATDEDNSTNDAVTYYFSQESGNDSGSFSIDPLTGEISVAVPLDYEQQSEFTLFVLANDTGEEPRTSPDPLMVTISLTNENDELPVFSKQEYTFEIPENGEPEMFVGQVQADDNDEGVFGNVRYSLSGSFREYFTINAETGEIVTQSTIDRDTLDSPTMLITVTASDMGQPAKTASVSVTVIITDLNDNPPQFSQDLHLIYLSPEQDTDVVFAHLEATDVDEGVNAEFTYEIVSQDDGISVVISQNGGLSLQVPGIPQDYQTVYNLVVRITDTQDSAVFDETVVHLIIEEEGDHHPRFTELTYEASVLENSHIGYAIFDISEEVSDEDPGVNSHLAYSLAPDSLSHIFSVNSTTGKVTLASMLDFETTESYKLTVFATDGTPDHPRTASATLLILVEDFNDWAPVYTNPLTAITVSTTSFSNIELFTVHAEDQDSGDLGDVKYSIDNSQPLFEVHPTSGVVTNKSPLMEVGEVSFVIRAFDSPESQPLMSSNITVTVTIQDPGDMAPMFVRPSPLDITISEDETFPSIIDQLSTTLPADSFHIVYTNATEGMFMVGENSQGGLLSLESELDYEEDTKYVLIVEARRMIDGDRYSSFLEVVINVDDVNDNSPIFSHIGVQSVSEAQAIDVVLFTVTATDADHGSLGRVTYEFVSGNNAKIFAIDSGSGEVSLSKSLDRETNGDRFELVVRASDGGVSDTRQSEVTVIVEVLDENDYPPHFEHDSYEISIYESPHSSVGDRLIQLTAIDLDSGPWVRYELFLLEALHGMIPPTSVPVTPFMIPLDSGVVTVVETLDRETVDYYLFNVTASDTINTAWTLLHVKVLDVNDHDPVITYDAGGLQVEELLPVGTLVTDKISVSDADSGPNGGIVFSLDDQWPDEFEIHPQTGVIRIREVIHYSKEESHFVGTVIASDLGVPPRTATAEITVVLQDVNDHPPMFTQPSYDISIAVDTPQDTEIFKFNATDEDHGTNQGIMFNLPSYYNLHDLFEVEADGRMVLRKNEDGGLVHGTHTFQVEIVNLNALPFGPQYVLATYADVTVSITPVNREKPVFMFGPDHADQYYTTIFEDFPVSEIVPGLGILALDADGDGIMYSIDSPPGTSLPFAINQDSGNVTLIMELDREEKDSYQFSVVATDTGFPPESSSALVTIDIGDVNDERPVFNASHYVGSVREASILHTFVLQVLATDRDLNEGSRVTYTLDSTYSDFPFEIDPTSGIITVAGDIDYEREPELIVYTFHVIASDMGIGQLASTAEVTVNILGVNEDTPEFVQKEYDFTVLIDARAGDTVGTVVASDDDGGDEGQLTYSFKNRAPEDYFEIKTVNNTGVIMLIADPQGSASVSESQKRAAPDVHEGFFLVTAEVVATDGGSPPGTGEATVYIQLHSSFNIVPVVTDDPPSTGASPPFEIISVVVGVVVVVAVAFVAVLVAACICRMKRKKGKAQITDTMNNDVELQRRYSSRASGSYSGTPSTTQLRHHNGTASYPEPNVLNHSPSGSGSSRHSYAGYAGDEDSLNGEANAARYSPTLPRKSPGMRSTTSDLASTVGTDMLTNASQDAPYPKSQMMAIYAANRELLDNDGSQDSVHMFGSEGGGEADGALDIDTILLSKYQDSDDDDEDSTTMAEDDASILEKDHSVGTDSSSHLDIRPMVEDEDPFQYSQSMHQRSWMPRAASNITGTINQIVSYGDSQEDPEPMHERQMYAASYQHSQGTSLYGGGALSQNSRIPLLPHHQQKPLPDDYPYFADHSSQDSHHNLHHLPPRSRRFTSSATALSGDALSDHHPMPIDHVPLPRHLRYSQDIPHPSYQHNHLRYVHHGRPHTPGSTTTTEGTITPNRALNQDYDQSAAYLSSSSSTSFGSTNINHPIQRGQRRYPHHHH